MASITRRFLSSIYAPLSWLIFIEIILCLPGSDLPKLGFAFMHFDKVVHFIIFGVFVSLWCFYLAQRNMPLKRLKIAFFIVFMLSIFNGIIIEYIQGYCIAGRSFDTADIVMDMLGSSIAYGIFNIRFT